MWRLWTRGWGPRDWWHWWSRQAVPIWIAWHLPRRLVYWCAVRVATQEPAHLTPQEFEAWEFVTARTFADGLRFWDQP